MPTAFTHALVGGAFVQAAPPGISQRKAFILLVMLAILPDLDVIAFLIGIPYAHPLGHRGFFHSIPFAATASFFVCLVSVPGPSRLTGRLWRLFFVAFLAASSHGILDAATDAGLGIGLFIPFYPERVFFEFRPIRTSPINPAAFFQQRSLSVLWSEVVWVWMPLFVVTALTQIAKRLYNSEGKRTV